MTEQLLTVLEVRAMLKIGHTKLYELMMSGALHSIKIGRSRRIPVSELDRYIQERLNAECR